MMELDAKQLAIAMIDFIQKALRQDADDHGRFTNGAQYRMDLGYSSLLARISDGVHDDKLVGFVYPPKTFLMLICHMMCESFDLERNPRTRQIEHPTDARIYEVHQRTLNLFRDKVFDQTIDLYEAMNDEAHRRAESRPHLRVA